MMEPNDIRGTAGKPSPADKGAAKACLVASLFLLHPEADGTPGMPRLEYDEIAGLSPQEVIRIVRDGVPARLIDDLVHDMEIPRTRLLSWMDIPEATAKRKIRQASPLSKAEGEQTLGLARLVGQVEQMVRESGDPAGFDAPAWLARWLSVPNPALGGVPPGDYMDTAEGRALISATLARMQSGAYA